MSSENIRTKEELEMLIDEIAKRVCLKFKDPRLLLKEETAADRAVNALRKERRLTYEELNRPATY